MVANQTRLVGLVAERLAIQGEQECLEPPVKEMQEGLLNRWDGVVLVAAVALAL